MSVKKGKVDGKIYDIVTLEELQDRSKDETLFDDLAIEFNDMIYPKRNATDDKPGVYLTGWGGFIKEPEEEEKAEYSSDNIIDFKSDNIKELIEKSNKLKNIEREILTTPNKIFMPPLLDNDEPEMRALKEAIIAKQIDINKYAHRFGSNFQNDRRYFISSSITINMLKRFLNNFDIKATLTLEDKNEDVPNPMNKQISVELLSRMGDIE